MEAKRKVQPSTTTNNTVDSIGGVLKKNFPLTKLRREKIKFFTEQTKNNIERFGLPGTYRWITFLTKFIKSPNVDEQLITSWLEREPSLINGVLDVHPPAADATTTQRYNIRPSKKAIPLPFEIPENWFNILERLDLNTSDSLPSLEKMAVYETTIKKVQENCQPSTSAGLRRLSEHDNKFENVLQIKMPELQLMEEPIEDEHGWTGTGATEEEKAAAEKPMHTEVFQEVSTLLDMAIVNHRTRPYCMPIYNLSPNTSPYFCELRQYLPFKPIQSIQNTNYDILDQSTHFNTDIESSLSSAVEIFQTEATKKFLDDRKGEEIFTANETPSTSKSEHRYSNILDDLRSIQQCLMERISTISLPKPGPSQDSIMNEDIIDVGMEETGVPSPKPIAPASADLSENLLPSHSVCLRALRSAVGENYIDLQLIAILEKTLTAIIAIKDTLQDIINSIENITISHDIRHKF